jgi:excisionase family DNA binding protein
MRRRRTINASQRPALESVTQTRGGGMQNGSANGRRPVDYDSNPLDAPLRPDRYGPEATAVASGDVLRRRQHNNQINFFTIPEVAQRLQVSARTIRRWIGAGNLIVHRLGGIVRIAEADLRAFLALHRQS